MAGVSTSVKVKDGMTSPFQNMTNAINICLSSFEQMQEATGQAVNTQAIQTARVALGQMNDEAVKFADEIFKAGAEQERFNKKVQGGKEKADQLETSVRNIVTAVGGLAAVKGAVGWIKESLSFADVQINAEQQLKNVLANVGATEDAFANLKKTASSIQGYSLYGDEAMIGGAAELSTYISDTDAIQSMMGTLSNYAAGMSGGGEVAQQQMVEYATQLGKALDGTFDGLSKKGFALSDAQKKIIEKGTDMEKALVIDDVISQSWANLAEQMANTPQGQMIQMKNTWGDMREEVGMGLYPAVLSLFQKMNENMPLIQNCLDGFVSAVTWIISGIETAIDVLSGMVQYVIDNWSWISQIAQALSIVLAILFAVSAATKVFNLICSMNPAVWVILAIVAAIYLLIALINHATGSTISATGVICGVLNTLKTVLMNMLAYWWNIVASFVNFFANVWNDPVGSIKVLFWDLCSTVIGYVVKMAEAIESVINKIPGVEVNITAGLKNFQGQIEKAAEDAKLNANWTEVMGKMEYGDIAGSFDVGYTFGEKIDDVFTNGFGAYELSDYISGMAANTESIADSTGKVADSMEITDEHLAYLRDIAEREIIDRTVFSGVSIDLGGIQNNVNNQMDLESAMEYMVTTLQEQIDIGMEGG